MTDIDYDSIIADYGDACADLQSKIDDQEREIKALQARVAVGIEDAKKIGELEAEIEKLKMRCQEFAAAAMKNGEGLLLMEGLLRRFRDYACTNQARMAGAHHNPIWAEVADAIGD